MDAGSSDATVLLPMPEGVEILPEYEGALPDIQRRTLEALRRLNAEFSEVNTKIHRFPRSLQGIAGANDRYIVPSVVAIGPYHHGSSHLQKMEEVKLAAANYFCTHLGCSMQHLYWNILSIAADARGYYDVKDPSVFDLSISDFATMMFLDGCFLLLYMLRGMDWEDRMLGRWMTPSIERDIFLLENQIPWIVLDVLTESSRVHFSITRFVHLVLKKFHPGKPGLPLVDSTGDKPPHLLGLLWHAQAHSMPDRMNIPTDYDYYRAQPVKSTNAVELAENGIRLTPSTKPWCWDMRFHRRRSYQLGELSLSPVLLNDTTACWLVNLAALEVATASAGSGVNEEYPVTYVVSSYLFMLAMLMDTEEEVQQMRSKYILHSTLSNKQALRFFKDLADNLRFGHPYLVTMEAIALYRRHVWITVYRFFYKNYKTIAAVLSVAGVLCSILNALYSLNKKPPKA